MKVRASDTVDDLVTNNIKAAKVLSKHGIDFFSDGDKPLAEACAEAGITVSSLLQEIADLEKYREQGAPDVATLELDKLADYIEEYHHHYTEENILFIRINLSRLVTLYGEAHPELTELKEIFDDLTSRMTVHMNHEKFIVFPYIRQLVQGDGAVKSTVFRSVSSPIQEMTHDHEERAIYLKKIHELTNYYSAPPNTGNAFSLTYAAMRELEKDLYRHITLEDEVLFPRALEAERMRSRERESRSHDSTRRP